MLNGRTVYVNNLTDIKPNYFYFLLYVSGKALTAKIVAKNGASQEDISKEKTLLKRAKRGEERAAAAALKRAEEKERQRMENMVKPYDMAKEQMIIMAGKLQKETSSTINKGEDDEWDVYNSQQMLMIAECKEMQVNEVLGLEAIYNTDDGDDDVANKEFCIAESSKFELLQQLIEDWQIDPESEQTLEKIVKHPPLSFTIQLVVDGTVHTDGDDVELATVILLNVTLPSLYPMGESNNNLPTFDIAYFCCTDRGMECTPDKPLNSLADLDETGLKESLIEEAQQLVPDPSIYMVVTACLMERIFEFVTLSVHGRHVLEQKRNSSDQ